MNNTIPAVEKTIQLLTLLAAGQKTQSELCAELGITMSTAYRILTTLHIHRWVRKQNGGIYSLAEGLLPLSRGISQELSLLDSLSEKLRILSETYNIAGKISVRQEDEQVTYFRVEPPSPVTLTGIPSSRFPLIEGSSGAALLAKENQTSLMQFICQCRSDIPEKQDPSLLLNAVREIRRRGSFLNIRKNRWNIAALSVPVYSSNGSVLASLTLIGCAEDFINGKREEWEKILRQTVQQ